MPKLEDKELLLDPKAVHAAQTCFGDALAWGCEPLEAFQSALVEYQSALASQPAPDHAGLVELLDKLESYLYGKEGGDGFGSKLVREAIAALSVQEPVALYQCEVEDGHIEHFAGIFGEVHDVNGVRVVKRTPLYATPPSPQGAVLHVPEHGGTWLDGGKEFVPDQQGDVPAAAEWKPDDLVWYDSPQGRVKAQVRGYVEGWVDLIFADGSTAICRPSRVTVRPASPAASQGGAEK